MLDTALLIASALSLALIVVFSRVAASLVRPRPSHIKPGSQPSNRSASALMAMARSPGMAIASPPVEPIRWTGTLAAATRFARGRRA